MFNSSADIKNYLNPNRNIQIMYTRCTVIGLFEFFVIKTCFHEIGEYVHHYL